MIEHEQRILLETAKLAKEKGYGYLSTGSYTVYLKDQVDPEYPEGGGPFSMTKGEVERSSDYFANRDERTDYSCETYLMCAAPTQSILARWLREAKNIHVDIYANASGWGWILTKTGRNGSTIKEIEDDIYFETYEIAMEMGLMQALELLKTRM